ncbi:MAG: Gluconolactonase, partial [Alphaproteobacteria bacterium MarineAlpha10_Bin3]
MWIVIRTNREQDMAELREIASGLRFPEGPIAMPDGSVILVEIEAGRLTRIAPDGTKQTVAEPGGGPNGAAIGPDGKCYVCNNGGFNWHEADGILRPVSQADDYSGGQIEKIDLDTGAVEVLYSQCGDNRLNGPNDIVFDGDGGFWFTDLGKARARDMDRGAVYYARTDGSLIVEVAFPLVTPNGIGLSLDDKILYVAETETSRLWRYDVLGPGKLSRAEWPNTNGGILVAGMAGYQRFDSLALDCAGNICVGTLIEVFPDARFIHVARDGRAVANSMVNVSWWDGTMDSWWWGDMDAADQAVLESCRHEPAVLAGVIWKTLMDYIADARASLP